MSFANKVVIVTGASGGIGAATALAFTAEGARAVLVARNETKLQAVAKQCAARGATPLVVVADVSKDDDVKAIVSKTINHFGQIDVLVNNAGFSRDGSLLGGNVLEAFDACMNTNLRAAVHLTSLAAPHLISTKGSIVNLSSVASLSTPPLPDYLPYYVSKAGLDHFTRCAALELAPSGVRVNVVNPGGVRTDFLENCGIENAAVFREQFASMTALKKISDPEEIADLIVFLASNKAKSITGSTFLIDNGQMLKS